MSDQIPYVFDPYERPLVFCPAHADPVRCISRIGEASGEEGPELYIYSPCPMCGRTYYVRLPPEDEAHYRELYEKELNAPGGGA